MTHGVGIVNFSAFFCRLPITLCHLIFRLGPIIKYFLPDSLIREFYYVS
jgi:hypothetical protein